MQPTTHDSHPHSRGHARHEPGFWSTYQRFVGVVGVIMMVSFSIPGGAAAPRDMHDERRKVATFDWGGELWQLTHSGVASMHSYYDLCPWNEDGDKIVFCSYDKERTHSKIYWLNIADGSIHFLDQSDIVDTHSGLRQQWLPGSNKVAFSTSDEQGAFLKVIDVTTGEASRMDGALRMLHPDGKRAVSHTNPRDEAAIARRDAEGVFVTEIASGRKSLFVTLQDAIDLHPNKDNIGHCKLYIKHTKWSPDGRKLLFVLTNEIIYQGDQPRVKSIFVVNADGSGLRNILAGGRWNHPSWHPDGRRILINLANEQGEMKMAYLCTETGRQEKVTERIPGGGHHPSVSPDGRRLVTEMVTYNEGPNGRESSGLCEIIILDIEKDTVRRTTSFPLTNHSHSGTHVHPVWSRDSSSVLYNSDQSGHSELYLLKLNN